MYLAFDIGGTKMRLAISQDGVNFNEPYIVTTPQSFEEGMQQFQKAYEELSQGIRITHIAGGIAGVFNRDRTELLRSPHLPEWIGNPLGSRIQEMTGIKVHFENDTAMVGLGEAVAGAGRGYPIVAYITISTGVGGARIVNKRLDVNTYNFEPGHQIIDLDGTVCPDCFASEDGESLGHWESLVSGSSVKHRTGMDPQNVQDERLWEEIAKLVAVGLNNTIVHWAPDVVVLGGGMMRSPGISIESVKTHLKEILKIYPIHPDIRKAELEDIGGLHGAFEYLRQHAT